MTVFKRTLKIGKDIAIFAGLFIIIYTAVNYLRRPTPPAQMPALTTLTGDRVSIEPNAPTLIYFWGTWCHICATTSPSVARLADSGYNVITVAVASGDDDTLKQYLDKKGYHFSVVNDDDGGNLCQIWRRGYSLFCDFKGRQNDPRLYRHHPLLAT